MPKTPSLLHPRCVLLLLLLGVAGLASVPAAAQGPSANVIRVTLVGERDSITPGKESWVAVRFQLDPGWHIYWTNPGDSGDPPRVQWRLPAGFQAGGLQWPHPERLVSKYAVDYGYAREMLLLAPIRVPAHLAPGSNAQIAGTVKWVVCREVCIPGKTDVALSLPVQRATAAPPNRIFDDARKRIPEPAPKSWRARARADKDDFVLTIETGKSFSQASFFPFEARQIENSAPQVARARPRGVQLRLKRSEQSLKPIAALKGVVVLPSGKAYVIDAPVSNAGAVASGKKKKG